MNTKHLSEELLQQVAIEGVNNYPSEGEHIKNCEACQLQLLVYQELLVGIEHSPTPAFHFNLQETVLQNIRENSSAPLHETQRYNKTILFLFTVLIFTTSVIYLFRNELLQLTKIANKYSLYLIIGSGLLLLGLIAWDMLREFEKKMNVLNHQ